jgi:hypothetical protein
MARWSRPAPRGAVLPSLSPALVAERSPRPRHRRTKALRQHAFRSHRSGQSRTRGRVSVRDHDTTAEPLNAATSLRLSSHDQPGALWRVAPFLRLRPRALASALGGSDGPLPWPIAAAPAPDPSASDASPRSVSAGPDPAPMAAQSSHHRVAAPRRPGTDATTRSAAHRLPAGASRSAPEPPEPRLAAALWVTTPPATPGRTAPDTIRRTLPWAQLEPPARPTSEPAATPSSSRPSTDPIVADIEVVPPMHHPSHATSTSTSPRTASADDASSRSRHGATPHLPFGIRRQAGRVTEEIIRVQIERVLHARGVAPTAASAVASVPGVGPRAQPGGVGSSTPARYPAPTRTQDLVAALPRDLTRQLLHEFRQLLRDERFRSGIVER